jgi:hypothetical protein
MVQKDGDKMVTAAPTCGPRMSIIYRDVLCCSWRTTLLKANCRPYMSIHVLDFGKMYAKIFVDSTSDTSI